MAVGYKKVRPAVVVEVKEHCAPPKILGPRAKTGGISHVGKCAVTIVVVKRRGIIGKIRAEKIQVSIPIVVGDG